MQFINFSVALFLLLIKLNVIWTCRDLKISSSEELQDYGVINIPADWAQPLEVKVRIGSIGKEELSQTKRVTLRLRLRDLSNNRQNNYIYFYPASNSVTRIAEILINNYTMCIDAFGLYDFESSRQYTFKALMRPTNREPSTDKRPTDHSSTLSEAGFINRHLLNNDYCGKIDPTARGIPLAHRGTIVGRGSWPWLVAIFKGSDFNINFLCGGTLVTSKAVISSAHCFTSSSGTIPSQEIKVFLGRRDFRNWSERGSLSSNCEQIHVHPDYRPDTSFDADIAILVLDLEVTFSRYIRPACIVNGTYGVEDIVDQEGVVSGWGKDETQQNSQIAKSIRGKVVTENTCFANDDAFRYLTSRRNFCAGNLDGTGPCAGDSGGGFLVPHNNQWTLRGTTSASLSTLTNECDLNKYIVYVDVSKFYTWIKEIIDNTS